MSSEHAEHLSAVNEYYSIAQRYYELVWYGKSLGLHYGIWDENVRNRTDAIIRENEVLADLAGINPGDVVLDAGCGVGGSGIWLAQNREAKVIGINIARNQLKIGQKLARKKDIQEVNLATADYHHLPFSGSFDVFWALESIEHTDDVVRFIGEAYRSLKKGGKAVIAGTFKGDRELSEVEQKQIGVGLAAAGAFNDFRSASEVEHIMEDVGFMETERHNWTDLVMKSAREMHSMCRLGLPFARLGKSLHLIPQIMADNTAWGTYQKDLFESGATTYNVLLAIK